MDDPDIYAHRRRSGSLLTSTATKGRLSGQYRDGTDERTTEDVHSSDDLDMEDLQSEDELSDDEETGLTQIERKQRRHRRRLDHRIGGNEHTQHSEEKAVGSTILRTNLINGLLIGLWYTFSISISVYNKWMFSKENLDFHYPLFTTSLHMIIQFVLAACVLYLLPQFRPKREDGSDFFKRLDPSQPKPKPIMTSWFYFSRIGPCGTATALDIGLGNFSLRFISLTFYTMCKSSVLAFVLVFAFLFQLEKPTWKLCAIILVMTAGVVMMVAGETAFNVAGFALVMSASFCSGFRWSMTQILLLRNRATSNPFSSIFFVSPVMFAVLFVLALPIEGPAGIVEGVRQLGEAKGWLMGTLILLFPGCLAFLMVAAEFTLLKRTSVVTLSVCGIFKEVLTISAAAAVFDDKLSPINISGLVVTIASIAAYNYLKYSNMAAKARKEAHAAIADTEDSVPLRNSEEQHESRPGGGERRQAT
ncbi:hypothetical protein LTR62_002451 [Meristemomyces frigidus]|uniref:Sugar phosphate transporter domain-containing protein n=1 Tax=Meristemomyces frigidus TaxID=1508187 RepID=A0AAN7TRH5_9PEZI|nr:hypothetical protein LTR62_002451 [Meristemomyces frigidus]